MPIESPYERLIQSSGSFYLTLASIIQSLALAFLLQQVFGEIGRDWPPLAYWLQSAVSFVIIVLVWHEYAMGAAAYSWMVDLIDSIIPFLFALTQYMIIYFSEPRAVLGNLLQPQAWLLSVLLFTLVTILAYWNQDRKVIQYRIGVTVLQKSSLNGIKLGFLTMVILSVVLLSSIFDLAGVNRLPKSIIPAIVLLLVFLHAIRIQIAWGRVMSNMLHHQSKPTSGIGPMS